MAQLDIVEASYETAIRAAMARGDNDAAHEHSIRLQEYRDVYKTPAPYRIPGVLDVSDLPSDRRA